jgi:hypothetical protein
LGVDRSAKAIRLAGRCGAPALLGDVFQPLLGIGCWQTVLLIDGKVGLGVDPRRILARAAVLAGQVGLRMGDVRLIGERVIAGMAVS